MHFGVRKTYLRLHELFPGHKIPYAVVENYVAVCPTCQKMRIGMTDNIQAVPRNLKVTSFHSRVGVDHLTVTPPDVEGHCCLIVVVVIFSRFVKSYAAKDYSADTLALSLFQFYCTYGTFDEIISDPGSAMLADSVSILHSRLGIKHRVSLVDRPESNGVERSNQEYLRHLRAITHDTRAKDKWGTVYFLSLVDLALNSEINSETGVIPMHAMFGSASNPYFSMTPSAQTDTRSSALVRAIDADLRLIKEIIVTTAQRRVNARLLVNNPSIQNMYQPGDFVLFHKWLPGQLRPSKLTSPFLGPYEVLQQVKNDVTCRHMATGVIETFYVERLKVFHGSREEARDTSLRDHDQYVIEAIVSHRGDLERRKHIQFLTYYTDGTSTWNPMNLDLSTTRPFELYCDSHPSLRRLLQTKVNEKKFIKDITATPIDKLDSYQVIGQSRNDFIKTSIVPHVTCYVDLRTWSDPSLTYFYSIGLPDCDRVLYLVETHYLQWLDSKHLTIEVHWPIFNKSAEVDSYWVYAYGTRLTVPPSAVLVTPALVKQYPRILKK
jgi:hypothetical protein